MTTQTLFLQYKEAQANYAIALDKIQDSISNSVDKQNYEKDTLYLQFLSELILAVHKKDKYDAVQLTRNKDEKFNILKAMY